MTTARRNRLALAGAFGLPLLTLTVWLLWVWPRPHGSSAIAETGPYILSLLTGVPFVWRVAGPGRRAVLVPLFLVGGFVVLWLYALVILCTARGVCL